MQKKMGDGATAGSRAISSVHSFAKLVAVSLALLAGQGALSAQVSKHPDLTGIWWNEQGVPGLKPVAGAVPFTAAGKAAYVKTAKRTQAISAGPKVKSDVARCAPFGVPRVWTEPFPVQVIQRDDYITFIYEHNRIFRVIYMNESLPSDDEADPYYLGHSVGRWEGDTLVIDTIAFNDITVLDDSGLPHSDQLKTVERVRKIDGGKSLEVTATITDPKFYSQPWAARVVLKSAPNVQIEEYICGEGEFDTRKTRAATK